MKQHPYWKEQNKIHPDIQEVRDEARHAETEQEKKLRLAREREELKQEGKRDRFFRKHPWAKSDQDPYYTKTQWVEGRESPSLPVNQMEGVRLGRKDSKDLKDFGTAINHSPNKYFGRISKQCEAQKSGVTAGYTDAMKDFEKAYGKKSTRDKPSKTKYKKVREIEAKKGIIDRVPKEVFGY